MMLGLIMSGAWASAHDLRVRDFELLRGVGETRWQHVVVDRRAIDYGNGVRTEAARYNTRRASAPSVSGLWPSDYPFDTKDLKMGVEFECYGKEGRVAQSLLRVMWFETSEWKDGVVQASPQHPPVSFDNVSLFGWDLRAKWEMSIGGNGDWRTRTWQRRGVRENNGVTGFKLAGWLPSTDAHDAFVWSLTIALGEGKRDTLTEAETQRLMLSDVLMFRVPINYAPGGWKPKMTSKDYVDGEAEWHIPMEGAKEAIGRALAVCKGEIEVEICGGRNGRKC